MNVIYHNTSREEISLEGHALISYTESMQTYTSDTNQAWYENGSKQSVLVQ